MRRDSDMSDLSSVFRLQQCFQCPTFSDHLIQLFHTRIMYLIQINIVCAEIPKTRLDICCHRFFCSRHGFCCQHELIPDSFQTVADILFTDSVAPCRVDVIDSPLYHILQQLSCSLFINLLNRNPAKSHAGNL